MKTLEKLTKKELIQLIIKIRPKSDAYDRICNELGIENNIIGEIKKLKKEPEPISICGSKRTGAWCITCQLKQDCELYIKSPIKL